VDFCGRTPLQLASALGHAEIVAELLRLKAKPQMISPVDGATAMMFAARGGHARALQVLLDYCETLDIQRANAQSADQEAAERELMQMNDINVADAGGKGKRRKGRGKGKRKVSRKPKPGPAKSKGKGNSKSPMTGKRKGKGKSKRKGKNSGAKRKRNAKKKKMKKKMWTEQDTMARKIQALARARLARNVAEEARLLKQVHAAQFGLVVSSRCQTLVLFTGLFSCNWRRSKE